MASQPRSRPKWPHACWRRTPVSCHSDRATGFIRDDVLPKGRAFDFLKPIKLRPARCQRNSRRPPFHPMTRRWCQDPGHRPVTKAVDAEPFEIIEDAASLLGITLQLGKGVKHRLLGLVEIFAICPRAERPPKRAPL